MPACGLGSVLAAALRRCRCEQMCVGAEHRAAGVLGADERASATSADGGGRRCTWTYGTVWRGFCWRSGTAVDTGAGSDTPGVLRSGLAVGMWPTIGGPLHHFKKHGFMLTDGNRCSL